VISGFGATRIDTCTYISGFWILDDHVAASPTLAREKRASSSRPSISCLAGSERVRLIGNSHRGSKSFRITDDRQFSASEIATTWILPVSGSLDIYSRPWFADYSITYAVALRRLRYSYVKQFVGRFLRSRAVLRGAFSAAGKFWKIEYYRVNARVSL